MPLLRKLTEDGEGWLWWEAKIHPVHKHNIIIKRGVYDGTQVPSQIIGCEDLKDARREIRRQTRFRKKIGYETA